MLQVMVATVFAFAKVTIIKKKPIKTKQSQLSITLSNKRFDLQFREIKVLLNEKQTEKENISDPI